MSTKLKKISKQHPRTWALLHRRLISTTFDYGSVFSDATSEFVLKKAASISSSAGYLISALLTTSLFVLSLSSKLSTYNGFDAVPNIYTIFVGPPSTGKSQAFKSAASGPLNQLIQEKELISFLIEKTTPSGLFKKLSNDKQGFLLSPEIYDVLIRLVKTDDGSCGDISLLCELFSGEGASFTMATQSSRNILPGTPFSILGSTQLPPLAKLLVTMDEGQGLLDRFLLLTPECFRPTPDETSRANDFIKLQNINSFVEFVSALHDMHVVPKRYYFSNTAKEMMRNIETDFVNTLNEAIKSGSVPPKSKTIDIVQRVALAIHVTDHLLTQLLNAETVTPPPEEIQEETLRKAFQLTNYCDMQKDILSQFLDSITNSIMEEEKPQPTADDIKKALCLFPGPIVAVKAFRLFAPRLVRRATPEEIKSNMTAITALGQVVTVKVPRGRPTPIFVKSNPTRVNWDDINIVPRTDFEEKYAQPINNTISDSVKKYLIERNYIERPNVQ